MFARGYAFMSASIQLSYCVDGIMFLSIFCSVCFCFSERRVRKFSARILRWGASLWVLPSRRLWGDPAPAKTDPTERCISSRGRKSLFHWQCRRLDRRDANHLFVHELLDTHTALLDLTAAALATLRRSRRRAHVLLRIKSELLFALGAAEVIRLPFVLSSSSGGSRFYVHTAHRIFHSCCALHDHLSFVCEFCCAV